MAIILIVVFYLLPIVGAVAIGLAFLSQTDHE